MMHTGLRGKKIAASIIILSVFSMCAPIAQASALPTIVQYAGGGNIGTISNAVLTCTGLKQKLTDALSSGIGALTDYFSGGGDATDTLTGDSPIPGGDTVTGLTSSLSVPINDNNLESSAQAIKKSAAADAASNTTAVQKACWQTVEKAAAQTILKAITKETVNWINHGFHGSPLYIQDTGSFLKGIRKQAIGDFTTTIGFDDKKYPFGKTVAQMLVQQTNSYFEQSAQYSLDKVIAQQTPGATSQDFQVNFANGGWDAFAGQFQEQNNPFGFNMGAQSTIANRISDTNYSPAQDIKDQIQRSGGFLDDKTCITPMDPADTGYSDYSYPNSKCKQWETETPGSIIVKKLDDTIAAPTSQLVDGKDITSDLTAILNALLAQGVKYSLKNIDTSKL